MEMLLQTIFSYSTVYLANAVCPFRPQMTRNCSTNCTDEQICHIEEDYNMYGSRIGTYLKCHHKLHKEFLQLTAFQNLTKIRRILHLKSCAGSKLSFNGTHIYVPAIKKAGLKLIDSPIWKQWPQCFLQNQTCEHFDSKKDYIYTLYCREPCFPSPDESTKKEFIKGFLALLNNSDSDNDLLRPATRATRSSTIGSINEAQTREVFRPSATQAPKPNTSATTNLSTSSSIESTTDTEPHAGAATEPETSVGSVEQVETTASLTLNTKAPTKITRDTQEKDKTKGASTRPGDQQDARPATSIHTVTPIPMPASSLSLTTERKTPAETSLNTKPAIETKKFSDRPRDQQKNHIDSDSDSDNDLLWVIPVAIIAVVLVVAGAIVGFVFWKRQKKVQSNVTQSSASVESADQPTSEAQINPKENKPDSTEQQVSPEAEPAKAENSAENEKLAPAAPVAKTRKMVNKSVVADGGEQDHSMQTSEGLLDKILRAMQEKEKATSQSDKSVAQDRTQR